MSRRPGQYVDISISLKQQDAISQELREYGDVSQKSCKYRYVFSAEHLKCSTYNEKPRKSDTKQPKTGWV